MAQGSAFVLLCPPWRGSLAPTRWVQTRKIASSFSDSFDSQRQSKSLAANTSGQERLMSENRKAVVITGASSGIGHACVSRMSEAGWRVFATVRKESDRDRLRSEKNVYPVIMDVQDASTISQAAAEIGSQLNGGGLDGLVNV